MDQELIEIKTTPATLDVNFEKLKAALEADLEKYDVVVTADTVSDAKKLATEINKTASELKRRRKEAVDEASKPINDFKDQIAELVKLCDDGRQRLLSQVQTFEDETRAKCLDLLTKRRDEAWEDFNVLDEFRRATVGDLAILSNLTAKGYLTSKAKGEVDARVKADLSLQDQTRRRIVELESRSRDAGLDSPLTRDHVHAYLFADEDTYTRETDRIIAAEVRRQEDAKARERERLERQQKAEEDAQRRRQVQEEQARQRQEAPELQPARPNQEHEKAFAQQGNGDHLERTEPEGMPPEDQAAEPREWVSVTATFVVQVPRSVTDQQIENKLRSQLKAAGFESRPDITIARGQ